MEIDTNPITHHCYECECGTKHTDVWNMLERMPAEKWDGVRDTMLRPVLLQAAMLRPKILPLAWVNNQLPVPKPEGLTRAQHGFYNACTLVQSGRKRKAPKNFVRLLWGVINALEESVDDLMTRTDLQALSVQLLEFIGKDMILEYIVTYIDDVSDFVPKSLASEIDVAYWLRMTGARDYGVELIRGFRADFQNKVSAHDGRTRSGVRGFQLGLAATVALEKVVAEDSPEKRDVATAMVLHARLGKGSRLGTLPEDVIAKCVAYAYPAPLVRWRVVLGI